LPRLPDPPSPVELVGPDRRRHVLQYEIWRVPSGISVELVEDGVPIDEGYRFRALGDHDANVAELVNGPRAAAEAGIGACQVERGIDGPWTLVGEEVVGRLVCDEENPDGPYKVVVDGHCLSWEEFGVALRSFEGWQFRLRIEDDFVGGIAVGDGDQDGTVVRFRAPRG
jgi:hypothetical protein